MPMKTVRVKKHTVPAHTRRVHVKAKPKGKHHKK